MLRRRAVIGLSLQVALAGCNAEGPATDGGEEVARAEAHIHGGAPDTAHRAVAALSGNNGMCTATIFESAGRKGFALTAAHCCRGNAPEDLVLVMGEDYANPSDVFYVTDIKWDRRYDAKTHDFCVLTFTGSAAQMEDLPTIPLLMPIADTISPGDALELVGYGSTLAPPFNTRRRSVNVTLETAAALTVGYSQADGGPCHGDSGGPGLAMKDGEERVAAVISRGDDDCTADGVSGRVSAVYDDFILPSLKGEEQALTCGECSQAAVSPVGDCEADVRACLKDPACKALVMCYDPCETDSCLESCTAEHVDGLTRYAAIKGCICHGPCSSECAGHALCAAEAGAGGDDAGEEDTPIQEGPSASDRATGGGSRGCAIHGRPAERAPDLLLTSLLLGALVRLLTRRRPAPSPGHTPWVARR